MAHRVPALFALTLSLLVLADADADADAHGAYHRGRYYNTRRLVRPTGRGRIGDGIIPVRKGNRVAASQLAKKRFQSNPFQEEQAGGRVLKKSPAQSPGGNDVPEGDGGLGAAPADVVTNVNVPDVPAGQGVCPPVRLSCTVYRTRRTQRPQVEECLSDADCGTHRKCCFDSCVQKDVCKSPVPGALLQKQQNEEP